MTSDEVTQVDCDCCAVRGAACADCVVSVLLGEPPADVRLSPDQLAAIEVLAASGLVPPLRMSPPLDQPAGPVRRCG
jgi:hypothetical protein